MDEATLDRFLAKIEITEECWLWTASCDGTGYGKISINGRLVPAHRASYELFIGPIPEGLDLDHLCRVHRCVRPEHLEPVTRRENLIRGETIIATQVLVDRCPQGHEYTPENIYRWSRQPTQRKCLTCRRERSKAKR